MRGHAHDEDEEGGCTQMSDPFRRVLSVLGPRPGATEGIVGEAKKALLLGTKENIVAVVFAA